MIFRQNLGLHGELAMRLVLREFETKYRGNFLGMFWVVLTPVLTALIFTFVFATVFKAKWGPTASGQEANFTLVLLIGIIVHGIFAECMLRAPGLIIANSSYVTKVVFPLPILPVVVVLSALITASIGILIVLGGNFLFSFAISPTFPLIVLVVLPYAILMLALVYFLAAFGTYLRDLNQIVSFVVTASLFLTPIFYPISAVPAEFQTLMRLNPLTTVVEEARNVLLYGQYPDFGALTALLALSIAAAALSVWIFQRLRTGFADVL